VHVWVTDWTPAGKVTISLVTVTGGQHAAFTNRGCHIRSSCTIPAPGKTPAELNAKVTPKRTATSITVKAVGQASAGKLSQPLAVSESVQLVVPTPTPDASAVPTLIPVQPGPLPTLNSVISTKLMTPGNAAGLFPSIMPSAAPATAPATTLAPAGSQSGQAVKVLPLGMSMMTAQLVGIGALLLAVVLAVLARLMPRRRAK
jgi:hypothetical protein